MKILLIQEMLLADPLRQKDWNETKKIPLKYFAYGFGAVEPLSFSTQSDFKISENGFVTNPLSSIVKGIDEIEKQHNKIDQLRSSLDYDIDGLVYKVNGNPNFKKDLVILLIHRDGQQHMKFQQKKL